MFGQVAKIGRILHFVGDANQESNIRGNIAPEKIFVSYDYLNSAQQSQANASGAL